MFIYGFFFAALVRKEISDETDRETGRSKQVSTVPIYLSIYSPNGNACLQAEQLTTKNKSYLEIRIIYIS